MNRPIPMAVSRAQRENMLRNDNENFHILHEAYHTASGLAGGRAPFEERQNAKEAIVHIEKALGGNMTMLGDDGTHVCSFCGENLPHMRRKR